jgi:RNA polymerase sigma-70 factor (ECF subfamily)
VLSCVIGKYATPGRFLSEIVQIFFSRCSARVLKELPWWTRMNGKMNIPKLPPHEEIIPTRVTLLNRLKNLDDGESWRDFFETYWKLIYGCALRYGLTEAEAEEVVQETVIEVSKKMPGFEYDPARSFKGWLLHTTRWRIQDQLRKRKGPGALRAAELDGSSRTDFIERVPDPAGDYLTALWDEEWQKNLLSAALDRVKAKVKPRQYQIFDLYVLKEWPVEKVAQTLRVSTGQVYLAKFKLCRLLKKEIKTLETKIG